MIVVFSDIQRITNVPCDFEINNIQNYVFAYEHVLIAINKSLEYRLLVRDTAALSWIKNMSMRYPHGTFDFQELDARQALAQKWGFQIPEEVHNEEIRETGLLEIDLQAQPGQDFADLVLSHFYAPLLSAKSFPFTQIPQLIQAVDAEKWQANRTRPLLRRTLDQRLEAWKAKARSTEQKQFIIWFEENPIDLNEKLMAFRVLQNYPSLGETILGDVYPVLSALRPQLIDLAVDEFRISTVVNQVTYYLNAHSPQSVEELVALLDQVSGFLWVEYESLEKSLLAHPEWISLALVDRLESKFDTFSRRLSKSIARIRLLIRPVKPGAPEADWSTEQMLAWATHSYLPYQSWCSRQEEFDKDLFVLGDQFSSWLMEHWNDIHANSRRMVFNILPNIASVLKTPGSIHLILVVDNLGWSFAEILRNLFQDKGYYLIEMDPYLAMLPTETEISKKCLLSGAVGYTSIDQTSYQGILERGWVPYFNDNAFRYISDIGKLNQVEEIDASVYVVNYLAVDKALHRSSDEIGIPHREHISHLLESLVDNALAFVEDHNLGDRIRIHIISDHGSTQIPADLQNDLDTNFFKQPGFTARSQRYLEVNNERFISLADNLKLDCFFLPSNDFLLLTNMLCARRANRFLPTDIKYFVHGGLLPEEVVVPYMVFEPVTIPLENLDILLKKNLFRYRLETIELEIGNPNAISVEQVQITSMNGNVVWDCEPIPLLDRNHHLTHHATARFRPTALPEEQTSLNLRVRYQARGVTHTFDIKLPIEMRKMVEEKNSGIFDD